MLPVAPSLSYQNQDLRKKFLESDLVCQSSQLDFTDGNRAEDKRFTGKNKPDFKINMQFQNSLPYKEVPAASYDQFKSILHQTRENKLNRASFEYDPLTPYFQIFSPTHIPITLSYTDVIQTLFQVLSLVYTKLTEISKTDSQSAYHLYTFIKNVDNSITNRVLKPILEDFRQVVTNKNHQNFVSVIDCLGQTRKKNLTL